MYGRIRIAGRVDDVRPYIYAGRVYICPLRVGGGTRLKLLEAMAMGKAIVSTRLGAEGISQTDSEVMLLRDSPEAFAAGILTLLENAGLREELGRRGQRLVAERYDWSGIVEKAANDIRCLVRRRHFEASHFPGTST